MSFPTGFFFLESALLPPFTLPRAYPLVMDIWGAEAQPGVAIQTWEQNSPNTDNQLWWLDPTSIPGYFWIVSKLQVAKGDSPLVVDLKLPLAQPTNPDTAPGSGTELVVKSQGPFIGGSNSQVWAFYPGPSGYCFIANLLAAPYVIDITGDPDQSGDMGTSGTQLQLYGQKSASHAFNQLWRFLDQDGKTILTPPPPPRSPGT